MYELCEGNHDLVCGTGYLLGTETQGTQEGRAGATRNTRYDGHSLTHESHGNMYPGYKFLWGLGRLLQRGCGGGTVKEPRYPGTQLPVVAV
jgi:hypothetical protein